MKILIAPDKFKGSLTANEVCDAIEKGVKQFDINIETIKHPLADGGEGTLSVLQNYFDLKTIEIKVQDPLFKWISASYVVSKDTAFIEMSNASGLQLLKKEDQNCYFTSTIGTGQLIADAISKGYKNINLFIGGSATNDAGIGMASALGYQFFDKAGNLLKPIGKELINIAKIDSNSLNYDLIKINFTVICDVKNPLYGKDGAAKIYGFQKGASYQEIELLDEGLQNFNKQVQHYLNKSVAQIEGAGAAGGLGGGAIAFLNAHLKSGIDFVLDVTQFHQYFKDKIDLIITGEGCVDKQTLEGKVVKGIGDISAKYKIPFGIISGIAKDKELILKSLNPICVKAIMDLNIPFDDAISNAAQHIEILTNKMLKVYFGE